MLIKIIEILGGLFLLLAPFVPKLRLEPILWVQIAVPTTGALIEVYVVLSYYIERLGAAQDPRYWRLLAIRNTFGGVIMGVLLTYALQYFCARFTKARAA